MFSQQLHNHRILKRLAKALIRVVLSLLRGGPKKSPRTFIYCSYFSNPQDCVYNLLPFFCGSFMFLFCLMFAMSLCASVYMCFVVTCWERADLLALVCGVYCEFVTFPLVSWVSWVLDCIDSWSLHPYLLCWSHIQHCWRSHALAHFIHSALCQRYACTCIQFNEASWSVAWSIKPRLYLNTNELSQRSVFAIVCGLWLWMFPEVQPEQPQSQTTANDEARTLK